MRIVETSSDVLAFTRGKAEQELLCVFNLGTGTRKWKPADEGWRVIESTGPVDGWTLPPLTGVVAHKG
jgi:hypothetical protein